MWRLIVLHGHFKTLAGNCKGWKNYHKLYQRRSNNLSTVAKTIFLLLLLLIGENSVGKTLLVFFHYPQIENIANINKLYMLEKLWGCSGSSLTHFSDLPKDSNILWKYLENDAADSRAANPIWRACHWDLGDLREGITGNDRYLLETFTEAAKKSNRQPIHLKWITGLKWLERFMRWKDWLSS